MKPLLILLCFFITTKVIAQTDKKFNGLDMNLGNIYRMSDAKTRSISPENFTRFNIDIGIDLPSLA